MKILIIEDEADLLTNMVQSLQKEKYVIETASDYPTALEKIIAYDYSCILLDINLPGGSGLELLKELKQLQRSDGVLIISAKDSLDDKLTGLDLGADDYLTKPFHLAELNSRIKAVLRRKSFDGQNTVILGNLSLNFNDRAASIAGTACQLNRKEYDMFAYFAENKSRLVTKTALAEHVWGDYKDEADSLEFI